MTSGWKIKCPEHNKIISSNKTIPISKDGTVNNEPIFYCEECGMYYIHTDAVQTGMAFDYGSKKVVNIENEPVCEDDSVEIICTELKELKSYTEPFIPDTCYKDQEPLEYVKNGLFIYAGVEKKISGYYCQECHDFYIEEELYDEIRLALPEKKAPENRTNTLDADQKIYMNYSIDLIRPKEYRLAAGLEIPCSYEQCQALYSKGMPFSLIHYAFVFRRFDIVSAIFDALSDDEIEAAMHFAGPEDYEWITPLVCAKWNLNYLEAYDDKNTTDISSRIFDLLDEVEHIDELMEYTDNVDLEGHNVFDIFWNGNQPMLDVIYYEKQKLASEQVEKNGFSIVMDEVGTGKTVSALYEIRNNIQRCIEADERARILIVCPYNKREDWQSDIRRQLGRYAHIVEQGDDGSMYKGSLKKAFFKKDEHLIFIVGQKQGSDKDGPYSALKGSIEDYSDDLYWNIVVIDEAHISFNNYFGIRAERAMLLTATPIVVNAKGTRLFDDYIGLVSEITQKQEFHDINPINKAEPDEKDVYVNWFREDMDKRSAERKIRFVSCKRWNERDDVFSQIKEEKGTLAALQYDQDDEYLYCAAEQYGFVNIHGVKKNGKIERLIALLSENNKSYIVFCEHKFVVDRLFNVIKDSFTDCVVAEKYGKFENQYGLENVQDGQLINTLMQALRSGRRTVFITTGKTGGTGLNLGEFDGVIHYELPFTSIELEQRFGRIDRIDTTKEEKARDMIFLLNECKSDENDMEINRMLYYCTTKIDITCQFMPIRNTVLYYPEFIKRNGKAIRDSLECFKKEYVLSEENEKRMKELRKNIRQYEKKINNDPLWQYIEKLGRNLRLSAVEALSQERNDRISEEYYMLLNEYLEYWQKTRPERTAYQRIYRTFLEAKKNANNWLAIVGLIKLDENSEVFVGVESWDEGEEQKIHVDDSELNRKVSLGRKSIQKQIADIIDLIDECVFDDEELKSFSSEGIFCYKDGMIHRSTVEEYRAGKAWR
ncbi:helicase-related protein [Lachnospiraceae bacterium C1.1]|nr:helicase-related protein [Lachnospiraceae bacterium C1.1]